MKNKIEGINKKFMAAILDTKEQFCDGLISEKEAEDQVSWASAEHTRRMERLKKMEQ